MKFYIVWMGIHPNTSELRWEGFVHIPSGVSVGAIFVKYVQCLDEVYKAFLWGVQDSFRDSVGMMVV